MYLFADVCVQIVSRMLQLSAVARLCVRVSASGVSCAPLSLDKTWPLSQTRPHPAFLHPLSPVTTTGLVPCRSVTTQTGGWYESLADSTAVHLMEQLLISTQNATGLPWWASIVTTTFALRTAVTLPLGVYQSIIIGKVPTHNTVPLLHTHIHTHTHTIHSHYSTHTHTHTHTFLHANITYPLR